MTARDPAMAWLAVGRTRGLLGTRTRAIGTQRHGIKLAGLSLTALSALTLGRIVVRSFG
jgi:hypothetical protein